MAINKQIAENLALLRTAVGAAGEDKDLAWWRSAFCGSMSGAYLAPIFPKTVFLAALTGVTDLEDALWEEVEVVRRGRTVKEWRAKDLSVAELTEIITAVKAR